MNYLKDKVKCPLCGRGIPTIDIDGFKTNPPFGVDYHCTKCNIWVEVNEVTNQEKAELFQW